MGVADKTYLVFQCYGIKEIFDECLFALLTFSAFHKKEDLDDVEIWIYTDNPSYFQSLNDCWLPLNFRTIDQEQIKQWRGAIDFVHRVKIEVLKDFTKDRDGNVLYLDTDIAFLLPIHDIFKGLSEGKRYMHIMEGSIESDNNVVLQKLHNYLKQKSTIHAGGKEWPVPLNTQMWNAGVLGFRIGDIDLYEVLTFTDDFYKVYKRHIVEQFAFSYYFQQSVAIKTAAPYCLHYWNFKGLRLLLNSFFEHFKEASWDELIQYRKLIQIPAEMQVKSNYLEYRNIVHHLFNKKWIPKTPDWDSLLDQL